MAGRQTSFSEEGSQQRPVQLTELDGLRDYSVGRQRGVHDLEVVNLDGSCGLRSDTRVRRCRREVRLALTDDYRTQGLVQL